MTAPTVDAAPLVGAEQEQNRGLDTTVGQSSARRAWGMVGQYGVLVLLAAVVLVPIFFALIQSLSPPFEYVAAGKPLHPVHVRWLDRTWWSGGPFSVIVRTVLLALAFAWLQLRSGGGTYRHLRPLLAPRRLAAVVLGVVGFGVTSSLVFDSLHAHDGRSALWILVALVVVTATQLVGLWEPDRALWRIGVLAVLTAVGVVAVGTVAVGASAWTNAWTQADLGPAMGRSFLMTIIITSCQLVTSVLAAYAFAFLRFPFRRLLFVMVMATLLLPLEVTLAGNVALIRDLGWVNSMQALVLPFAASGLGTFLILQGFRGIPPEIRDATRLDGYGHLTFLWKFAVPLTRPVVASFTVISALGAWNQYLWPRAVIDADRANTMQIQLRSLIGENVANANITIAGAIISALPVVVLLIAFQKQIIRGLTAGAVK